MTNVETGLRPAALVTGAATRLGYAFATALAHQGYDIALHYNSSEAEAQQAAVTLKGLGVDCQLFQYDLSGMDQRAQDVSATSGFVAEVQQQFPRLSVLLNSASAYAAANIADTPLSLLRAQFEVNFFAPFELSKAFYTLVDGGHIINILDNKIAFQQHCYAAYLLSKKTLAELTQMAAVEFAPKVRVNGIAPGVVMPGEQRTDDYIDWRVEGIPLRKQGEVAHLTSALGYLLNNEFVTGQILTVDGGEGINHVGRNAEEYAKLQALGNSVISPSGISEQ